MLFVSCQQLGKWNHIKGFAVISHGLGKHWKHWEIPGRSMRYFTISPCYLTQALRQDTNFLLGVCTNLPAV